MKFHPSHCDFFNATSGAYSVVTDTEIKDSQITLTDFEAELVISHFPEIHIGKKQLNPQAASKEFILFNTKDVISLTLNYPKEEKKELRLYLSKGAGFMPAPGDIIFFYIANGALHIGNLPENIWRDLTSKKYRIDTDDEEFQNAIEFDSVPDKVSKTASSFPRDARIAKSAIAAAGYACENVRDHWLFRSRRTSQAFVEAHHLFPVAAASLLGKNLDVIENIFALCPGCHRAIHYGDNQSSFEIINNLFERRKHVFEKAALDYMDLLTIYSVEKIDSHAT